jgi:hypothetical protein
MDVKFVPVSEVTDLAPIKGTLTPQRSWPFKLTGTKGEEIYLSVYESEIKAVLKKMSDIVEGL